MPFFGTAAFIGAAMVLGGGTRQGLWSDAVLQLAGLAVLAGAIPNLAHYRVRRAIMPLALAAGFILIPLAQLIPLPPWLWPTLPSRTGMVTNLDAIGAGLPWEPISLDPAATWRSVLSLIVPIAVFIATLRLGHRARRSLSLLLLAVGIVSVALGLGQLMEGPQSPLRLFPITNPSDSVGFFANRNHYAALLYCLIPFTAAWLVAFLSERLRDHWLGVAACAATYVGLVVGLAMSRSRAGLFLAVAAGVASLLLAAAERGRMAKRNVAVIGATLVVATVAAFQFGFFGIMSRMDNSVLADLRFTIASTTITAARSFLPVGSGFGTFVNVYQMFEPPSALIANYINHAHDDWLEIWLEGGWAAAAAAAAFLVWFVMVAIPAWKTSSQTGAPIDRNLKRAATIAIAALLIHSLVDYPLRTTAMMTLLAFCCGLLVDPIQVPKYQPPPRKSRTVWKRLLGGRDQGRRRGKAWSARGTSG